MLRSLRVSFLAAGITLTLTGPLAGQAHSHSGHDQAGAAVPLYGNLGDLRHAIRTAVPMAQQYFDQGLRLTYGFNHPEAIASYKRAQELDPACAMCYWGEAWALGPNINAAMDSASGAAAYQAARRAVELMRGESPGHGALIEAMAQRYGANPTADRKKLDSAYARAMGQVAARYPDDPEAQVLHAEALMVLSPWKYWAGSTPRPGTEVALNRLTTVMQRNPNHPGACHFFIHAVEAPFPERAVPCAERLAALMPGAGHIVHMPGHIYIRVGRYLDAIRANEHAVHADETWMQDRRPGLSFYTAGYYPHNYDFMAFAAAMAGRSAQAIQAAERVAALVPTEMLREPGLTLLQQFITRPLQFRIRFGRWEEILATPSPADDLLHAQALWRYARGRAYAAQGNLAAAEAELARVRAAAADPRLRDVSLEFNQVTAVLSIAANVLAGQVAAAKGDRDGAIASLREAARLEDDLVYGEPPEWSVPVRHELGAQLLTAGRAAEAEAVYRQDLERFPKNGWSLFGLARALEAQGKNEEAGRVRQQFEEAWRAADVQLTAQR